MDCPLYSRGSPPAGAGIPGPAPSGHGRLSMPQRFLPSLRRLSSSAAAVANDAAADDFNPLVLTKL
eukprot:1194166-Prorocentrum_minimum.AAC.1